MTLFIKAFMNLVGVLYYSVVSSELNPSGDLSTFAAAVISRRLTAAIHKAAPKKFNSMKSAFRKIQDPKYAPNNLGLPTPARVSLVWTCRHGFRLDLTGQIPSNTRLSVVFPNSIVCRRGVRLEFLAATLLR